MIKKEKHKPTALVGLSVTVGFQDIYSAETIKGDTGCLLVNGKTSDDETASLLLTYQRDNKKWMLDRIHVEFIDPAMGQKFIDSPACNDEGAINKDLGWNQNDQT